jgi:hypothetical protein
VLTWPKAPNCRAGVPQAPSGVTWEPFEDDLARGTMDALIEMNVKLAAIQDHLAAIRFAIEGEDDDEEEEEGD